MKPHINILILALLFSCSDKKNVAIDNQRIETVKETNLSNKDTVQKKN